MNGQGWADEDAEREEECNVAESEMKQERVMTAGF